MISHDGKGKNNLYRLKYMINMMPLHSTFSCKGWQKLLRIVDSTFFPFFHPNFSQIGGFFLGVKVLEYAGIGNHKRLGIIRGNPHISSSVVLQGLELVEGWKFGRGELSEVLLYRYIEEEYIKKSKLIPDLRTMNIEG